MNYIHTLVGFLEGVNKFYLPEKQNKISAFFASSDM